MDILKFTLSGKTAFFKKPEVNAYGYYTYGCIHKVALLGLFGSVLGLGGYAQREKENMPEFYEVLNHIQVAIQIRNKDAYIPKKIQIFNNTVGYASLEQGGILNVKEQWLENPVFDIYVQVVDEVTRELASRLENKVAEYIPYLGKNDHPANITGVCLYREQKPLEKFRGINSIMEKEKAKFYLFDDFEEEMEEDLSSKKDSAYVYRYEEALPVALSQRLQQYVFRDFIASNLWLKEYQGDVYQVDGSAIVFF